MRIIPEHCNQCTWFFSKMGACPNPQASILFSYISLLPYFIIFYLIGLTIYKRKVSLIRVTTMLVIAYIIGDKILKNIFKGQRPPFSCKETYGMPSSHMTVMVGFTYFYFELKNSNFLIRIALILVCLLQGFARIKLHYHTFQQVFGGIAFGFVFALVFFWLFDLIWAKIKDSISRFIPVVDDIQNLENKQCKRQ